MRITDFMEGFTDTVYHVTTPHNAYQILSNDEFKLSYKINNGTDQAMTGNKMYYLSTTRSRHGNYHRHWTVMVMFELDGRGLGRNYKSVPVDYWNYDTYEINNDSDEMEDRLVTNKPTIPALKYIRKCYILLEPQGRNEYSFEVYRMCRKNKIPVFVYDDKKEFKRLSSNYLSHNDVLDFKGKIYHPQQKVTRGDVTRTKIGGLIELYRVSDYSKLTQNAKDLLNILDRDKGSFVRSIRDFSKQINKGSESSLRELMNIFRREKIHDIYDFLGMITDKHKKAFKEKEDEHFRSIFIRQYEADKEKHDDVLKFLTGKIKRNELNAKYDMNFAEIGNIAETLHLSGVHDFSEFMKGVYLNREAFFQYIDKHKLNS